jgi:hypothetical protein
MTGLVTPAIAQSDPLPGSSAAGSAALRLDEPATPQASIPATGDNALLPGAAPAPSTPVPGVGELSTDMLMRAVNDPLAKPLSHRIDVSVRNATIEHVAEALSNAGNVDIAVDRSVPLDKAVSVDTRDTPLYHVLEAVAQRLGLVVAKRGGGLVFKLPPVLELDHVKENPLPSDPWDEDLRGLVEAIRTLQLPFENLTNTASLPTVRGPRQSRGPQPYTGIDPTQFASSSASGVALTGIGADMLAVAEPGRGPAGEPGYWLTIYRIAGDKLTKVATKFHQAHGQK